MALCPPSNKVLLVLAIVFGILGIVLIVLGIAGPFAIDDLKQDQIDDQVKLSHTDSDINKSWLKNNGPDDNLTIYFKCYLFNITNLDDVLEGAKPHIEEIGPYVFTEYWEFIDLHLNKSQSTATTYRWEYFHFEPELSGGLDAYNDVIVTGNLGYAGVLANISPYDNWLTNLAFASLGSVGGAHPFQTIHPTDLVFGGEIPFLEFVKRFKPDTKTNVPIQANQTDPQDAREQLGAPDVYDMGEHDVKHVREYIKWKGDTHLDIWGTEAANKIRGTDGKTFPPGIKKTDKLIVFEDDLTRTADLTFVEETSVKGIDTLRFHIDPSLVLNVTENPANAAYFMNAPRGVMNISSAEEGAPIFASKPHFLDGDLDYYLNLVTGLTPPNRTEHDTILDVEPETGLTMNAYKRLQINLKMGPVMLLAPKLREFYLPIGWFEESGMIDDADADKFKSNFDKVDDITLASRVVGYGLGAIFLIAALALLALYIYRRRKQAVYDDYDNARTELIS